MSLVFRLPTRGVCRASKEQALHIYIGVVRNVFASHVAGDTCLCVSLTTWIKLVLTHAIHIRSG